MNKTRGSLLAFLAAAAWSLIGPYFWEFVREFVVYEQASKLLHLAVDRAPIEALVRFVPSLIFVGVGGWLLYRSRSTTTHPDERPWLSSYRILQLADPALARNALRADGRAEAREDLHEKLKNGELIAKGFRHPIHHHTEEIEIPPIQWRTIRFNHNFTEAQAGSIRYSGIAVARASS
jgi:hypothetical protein